MIDEAARVVQLANGTAAPVDHLRCQHAANAELLAEAQQYHIDAGRINVGQLGEIADAQEHRGVGIATANLQVAAE